MKEGRKLKILEVCTVPTEKSGIPNVIFNLMGHVEKSTVEWGYVSINDPSEFHKKRLDSFGAALHVIPRKISSPWRYVASLAKIARGYDIIHIHGNSATMVLELIASKMAGVKVRCAHSHSTSCKMKVIDRMARPVFHKLCNLRLACGEAAGKWLFGQRKFEVIRNGVDTSAFSFAEGERESIRRSLNIDGGVVIGHVANFDAVKNHTFLLDVFKLIAERHQDCRLLLVGAGQLKESVKDYAENLGIGDKVIFTGSVDNPRAYMSAMDIVVMPSLYEGLPLTLVEEQANGLSCVVSTGVSREADLTGNLRFVPLDGGVEMWRKEIEEMLSTSRHDGMSSATAIKRIKDAGYDIRSSAKDLMQIFSKQLNTMKK